jgi:uncharacterized membrane protein YagU involved in acid resistance
MTLSAAAVIRPTVRRVASGAAIGLVAGLGGGAAMGPIYKLWGLIEKRVGSGERHGGEQGDQQVGDQAAGEPPRANDEEPATVKAAEAMVGPIAEESKERAGTIAHYVMSGLTGAIYGALLQVSPRGGIGRGLAYGSAVWLVADETIVPLLRLARAPWTYPVRTHVLALLAHLTYGAALDGGSRLLRRAFAIEPLPRRRASILRDVMRRR